MNHHSLPDIALKASSKFSMGLDWVGMSDIELPVNLLHDNDTAIRVGAKVQAYVNLEDPDAKGIHMSRLYLTLNEHMADKTFSPATLKEVLLAFAESHKDLSSRAMLEFDFDYIRKAKSLKSENYGWKGYPVKISGTLVDNELALQLQVEIPYSSTCPCSAALARQLIQEKFTSDFADQDKVSTEVVAEWLLQGSSIMATPHSQRSYAQIKVRLSSDSAQFPIDQLIDQIEDALKTPVQAAVKREDEQEFARLNGANLMFCEDAARRIKSTLEEQRVYEDYWVRVDHIESLHPHNAVSIVTKGLNDGFKPIP
ncbi:MAG: GTP cyclohydrolase FolE2 [Gammaproteobacteria bacterium]